MNFGQASQDLGLSGMRNPGTGGAPDVALQEMLKRRRQLKGGAGDTDAKSYGDITMSMAVSDLFGTMR